MICDIILLTCLKSKEVYKRVKFDVLTEEDIKAQLKELLDEKKDERTEKKEEEIANSTKAALEDTAQAAP